jgi:hypothetical protein
MIKNGKNKIKRGELILRDITFPPGHKKFKSPDISRALARSSFRQGYTRHKVELWDAEEPKW